ncbi:MAG TPA: hypothetical protein VLK56_02280 [Solirubrobacterales bacterium]|nr:hypothetical protein [Solirubrobacterales bacterium]
MQVEVGGIDELRLGILKEQIVLLLRAEINPREKDLSDKLSRSLL